MLNQIGVKATVNVVEGGVFSQMTNARKFGPMYMVGWYSVGDADFASVWYTKGGFYTKWIDPEYEALFVAARSTNDLAERCEGLPPHDGDPVRAEPLPCSCLACPACMASVTASPGSAPLRTRCSG